VVKRYVDGRTFVEFLLCVFVDAMLGCIVVYGSLVQDHGCAPRVSISRVHGGYGIRE
jgi:hypothetical protein